MPPPSCTCADARPRPAAVVNQDIRRLAGREELTGAQRERMAALWAEYARAVEAERDAA